MAAYLIADVRVTNPAQYETYKKWSSQAITEHQAEVCVRGGKAITLEGDWTPERIVVLKFADIAAAQAYYESSSYQTGKAAREGAAIMRMVVVEGV